MIDSIKIKNEIKKGLKNKTIKTEDDAKAIANKFITDDEPSYEATLQVSKLLSRKVDKIIHERKFKHSWFKGKIKTIVYFDVWGRLWSKTKGVIKNDVPTYLVNGHYCINGLGGMVWNSKKGKTFICEYRTSIDEIKNRVNPETFI